MSEQNAVEIVETYPNGRVKDQCTTLMVDGVKWRVVESFDSEGQRTHLIQVSPDNNPVREITYQNGKPVSIFLPAIDRELPGFRFVLKSDGLPKHADILLQSGKTDRWVFKDDGKVEIYTQPNQPASRPKTKMAAQNATHKPSLNVAMKSSANPEAPLLPDFGLIQSIKPQIGSAPAVSVPVAILSPDDVGNPLASNMKTDIGRAYFRLPNINSGLPDTPTRFRLVSLYPNGDVRRAQTINHEGQTVESLYDKRRALIAMRTHKPNELITLELMTDAQGNKIPQNNIIENKTGGIKHFGYHWPNGRMRYSIGFPESAAPNSEQYHFIEYDSEQQEIFSLYRTGDKARETELTPEQNKAQQIVRHLVETELPRVYQYFHPDHELSKSLHQAAPYPIGQMYRSWKIPLNTTCETQVLRYSGQLADALIWKDEQGNLLHITEKKPDESMFREIWYVEGKPRQIDFFGASANRTMSIVLDQKGRTDAMVLWYASGTKPKEIYRFDIDPEFMVIESYPNSKPKPDVVQRIPMNYDLDGLSNHIQSLYVHAMLPREYPTNIPVRKDARVLDSHPKGNPRIIAFEEENGRNVVCELGTNGQYSAEYTIKPNTQTVRLFGAQSLARSEYFKNEEQGVRTLKLFSPNHDGSRDKPPLHFKLDLYDNKGTFSIREYEQRGGKDVAVCEAEDVPLSQLKEGASISLSSKSNQTNTISAASFQKAIEDSEYALDHFLHPATARADIRKNGERIITYSPSGSQKTETVQEHLRADKTLKMRTTTRPNGSITEEFFWRTDKHPPVPRCRMEYVKRPFDQVNSRIYMHEFSDLEKSLLTNSIVYKQSSKPPHKKEIIDINAIAMPIDHENIKNVREDAERICKHHARDIIVDFHGVTEFLPAHREAIEEIEQVLNEELHRGGRKSHATDTALVFQRRKICITGIDTGKGKRENVAMERAIREAFPQAQILPNEHSMSPDLFGCGIPVKRQDFDVAGKLVYEELYEPETATFRSFQHFNPRQNGKKTQGPHLPYNDQDLAPPAHGKGK